VKLGVPGRRALVTGASGGLGEAIVRRLRAAGVHVVATGRRVDALDRLAATCGAEPLACDLADRHSLPALIEVATSVDLLVCNAALPATGPLWDFTVDEIDRALDVNLRAPLLLARAAGTAMAARGVGHIVLVSSMGAKAVGPALALYSATKAGMRALALSLRQDLQPTGVGVSVVLPGPIGDAGMWADAGVANPRGTGRPRSSEDVAAAVVDAVERDRAEVEVASPVIRAGAVLAQVRPSWFMALGRRSGADRIAAEMTAAHRDKR
jgi:short-subunit dehydrogenase